MQPIADELIGLFANIIKFI